MTKNRYTLKYCGYSRSQYYRILKKIKKRTLPNPSAGLEFNAAPLIEQENPPMCSPEFDYDEDDEDEILDPQLSIPDPHNEKLDELRYIFYKYGVVVELGESI